MSSKVILNLAVVAILCHLAQPKPTGDALQDTDYSGCGESYQCFGIPGGCPATKNCDVLLKTKPAQCDSPGADFTIFWQRNVTSDDKYVAVGLSEDDKMGDDSVTIFFVKDSGDVTEAEGLTFGGDQGYGVKIVNASGFSFSDVSYKDGLLEGSFLRSEVTKIDTKTFNLKAYKYYVFLAYGPVDDQGNVKHHDAVSVSDKAVSLEGNSCDNSTTTLAPTTTAATTKATTEATTKATTEATTPAPTTEPPTTTVDPATNGTTASGNGTTPEPTTPQPKGSAATTTLNMFAILLIAILIFVN